MSSNEYEYIHSISVIQFQIILIYHPGTCEPSVLLNYRFNYKLPNFFASLRHKSLKRFKCWMSLAIHGLCTNCALRRLIYRFVIILQIILYIGTVGPQTPLDAGL